MILAAAIGLAAWVKWRPASPEPRILAAGTSRVTSEELEAQQLAAPQPPLPDEVLRRESGRRLVGGYDICVGPAGDVTGVKTVASIPGADAQILDTLKTWKYRPQPAALCGAKVLTFQVP
jgi:hypothetical protein